jgi:hypothetical protein
VRIRIEQSGRLLERRHTLALEAWVHRLFGPIEVSTALLDASVRSSGQLCHRARLRRLAVVGVARGRSGLRRQEK